MAALTNIDKIFPPNQAEPAVQRQADPAIQHAKEPAEQNIDAQKLFEGAFVLGISRTWAEVKCLPESQNLDGAEVNFRVAEEALAASNAFNDMSMIENLSKELDLNNIKDPQVMVTKVVKLKENLSGQLTNRQ